MRTILRYTGLAQAIHSVRGRPLNLTRLSKVIETEAV